MPDRSLSMRLAEHIVATSFADLPPATVTATKASVLDAIGVSMAATTLGEGTTAFAELAMAPGGPEEAVLFGRRVRVPMLSAALANGALAHAIDFEDGHDGAPVHPNAVQIPAALALADARGGVSGRDLLTALAIGCDLTCRLGLSLTTDPARNGWYPPPILGAFGAVAAVAKLARLDARQIVDALSLLLCSATCSGEIKHSPRSHLRAVRDAFPAQAALQAVLLASRGVAGFDAPLEGKAGFFALYAGGGYDRDVLLAGLGKRFEGEQLTFKAWPSCRGTHAFIEGAFAIRQEIGDAIDAIDAIDLYGHPVMRMLDEPHDAKRAPATAIDGKFSAPFTAAAALLDGKVTLDSFDAANRERTDIATLARKVRFTAINDAAPGAIASGGIAVRLRDGRSIERFVNRPLGHPANPLGDEALAAKFRGCAAHAVLPPDTEVVEAIIARVRSLDQADDLRDFFDLLAR